MSVQETASTTDPLTPAGSNQGQPQKTEPVESNDVKPMTQADVDRAVTLAVQKNMANMEAKQINDRKAFEDAARRAQLESEGKHEQLLAETNAELAALKAAGEVRDYRLAAREVLDQINMSRFADELIASHAEPKEITRERAERLKTKFDEEVQKAVAQKFETGAVVPKNTNAPQPKDLDGLTRDEWAAEKKRRGLM